MTNTIKFRDSEDENEVVLVTGPGNNKKFNSVEVLFDKIKGIKFFKELC